jgi:hypothetical protein
MRLKGKAILTITALVCLSAPAWAEVDFLDSGQFRYGMLVTEANELLAGNESDFIIQYRIDTPSTNEISCVYKETEYYLVRFYQGSCYFIERRAEIEKDAVPGVFEQFTAKYGDSPEMTQSSDQRLWYGHWILRDRDVELTAYDRTDGKYLLTYQEFDPMLQGEALHVQEQEYMNKPVQIDPITGKPRLVEGDESQGDQSEAEGEPDGGEGQDSQAKDSKDGDQKESAKDDDSSENNDSNDDDDDDWDWYYG